ncbi:hypothetical protein IRZ83_19125 [Flavobacterium sp. JLP]|uniref:hypothetical protein n=1 Tax=unclassified Flavobacterium TaxID=196869 RepID=UPI00188C98AA|nr:MULTISPECIES: hypothetical protein [unclassified Flavobacterium]MBF4494324.1 hypothetical protein [Flavobacterium sp. MR2016-29]MBF4508791.1 hypothetical protein [Flavobacterium sp. JLP]
MIVWSGRGFLSVLILFIAIFSCISIFPETYIDLCFIVPLYVAGIFSYIFGIRWNRTLRVFIDKETGKEINFKSNHSLFWIKMEYWGFIFTALGLIILAQNLDKSGIDFYTNILLALIGIGGLIYFGINLVKIKSAIVTKPQFDIASAHAEPKLSFIKEEISNPKFESEDPNQYLPK